MVVYIYYIMTAGNSISAQLSSSFPGQLVLYGKGRLYAMTVHHIQNHTCWVTVLQPARRAAVLGLIGQIFLVYPKGVGPSMTLAWPGWKQSDIAVEVNTGRLETSRFKKCCANCVLLYFPSTEFKSAFNVY